MRAIFDSGFVGADLRVRPVCCTDRHWVGLSENRADTQVRPYGTKATGFTGRGRDLSLLDSHPIPPYFRLAGMAHFVYYKPIQEEVG